MSEVKTKHLPTPWEVDPGNCIVTLNKLKNGLCVQVAECDLGAEGKANAAFIVHAVNMHQELVDALRCVVAHDYGKADLFDTMKNTIDDLLARAEGGK
jgi:hypothetical protein